MNEIQMGYHYNVDLPQDVSTIIEQDFWMLENIGPMMLGALTEPVKFASSSWIIVTSGSCKVDINLISYEIKAPALITIRSTQIMQPTYISPDFNASVIVMSKRFRENVFLFTNSSSIYQLSNLHSVVSIPENLMPDFNKFMASLREILHEQSNPYVSQALLFQVVLFIYRTAYKCYEPFKDEINTKKGRISDKFLLLVQQFPQGEVSRVLCRQTGNHSETSVAHGEGSDRILGHRMDRTLCDSGVEGAVEIIKSQHPADSRRIEFPVAILLRKIFQEIHRHDPQGIQKFVTARFRTMRPVPE